jgi:hypothetical protein
MRRDTRPAIRYAHPRRSGFIRSAPFNLNQITNNMKQTLEQYLNKALDANIIDHVLRASFDEKGRVNFYIHPHGKDGDTADFVVIGNRLELPRKTVAEILEDPKWQCPWCEETLTHSRDPRMKAQWFHCTSQFCGFETEVAKLTEASAAPRGMLAPEARGAEEENLRGVLVTDDFGFVESPPIPGPDTVGGKVIDAIVGGNLAQVTCAHDESHGCIIRWVANAEEQIEAAINSVKDNTP